MSFIVVTLTYLKLSGVNYSHGYFLLKIGVTKSNTPIKSIDNYIPPHLFHFKPAEQRQAWRCS